MGDLLDVGHRLLALLERAVEAHERQTTAIERLATAAERQAGMAAAAPNRKRGGTRPRRVPTDAPVDDVTKQRARRLLRNSGFRVDEE